MSSPLHQRVVESLGQRIVSGELAPGRTMQADGIAVELGVSRSVVREAVRVLQSLGLVEPIKRVGVRVQPMSSWLLLDPALIRWRLHGGAKGTQLRSLTELRAAVEPAAAALAADNASDLAGAELISLAGRMRAIGRSGDLVAFLELDIRFHETVLSSSGNEMFAQLHGVIAEVLRGRTADGLMPEKPHEEALQLHLDVADAILGRRPDDARAAMARIMHRATEEMAHIWDGAPRVFLD
ncbi:FadR/GntR family transcriptional regulator [Microbacterium sp. No. 7]|uniref:FadR/GntR family transcriptional regulator n=1 Tax=Microbacterium sp. No. 7 TaxID=1714373 RepID=UPI0006D19BEC|nr:FCD domain-containing protein [Microbacterium sp. No. 7]ALJ19822.1 transcriptional regulator [Microbacterium sp. No. 7]